MSTIEKQVRNARHRLWINRWLGQFGWSLFVGACLWALTVIADRLFSLGLPLRWIAISGGGLCLLASLIWLFRSREHNLAAAVALDESAGLKERVSTALATQSEADDPFSRAVAADAERSVTGLSAKKLIPLRWSGSLSYGSMMLLVGLLLLLLPEFDLLKKKEAQAGLDSQAAVAARLRDVVAQPVSAISQLAEKQQDAELEKQIKALEETLRPDPAKDPDVLRRETVKQLDKLQDTMKDKANEDRFKALDETKKRLKQAAEQSDPKGELGKLIDSLSAGDFQQAQKEIKELQEKLAKRSRDGKIEPKQAEALRKQLNDMAKKLEQAAQDQQSEREMQNAGLSKQDMQRVLDTLAKKDPKQIEKLAQEMAERMKEQGVTQQQLKQMMDKIAQRQQACKALKEMGKKMGDASKKLEQGDCEAAQSELGEAGEQLSEMEQLEQQLNELEGQMAQLDEARNGLNEGENEGQGEGNGNCKGCGGSGFRKDGAPCPHCNGTGNGMGGAGRGSGKRDRAEGIEVGFKNSKAKVKTTKGGKIISQQFVKGQHLKGKSDVEFYDAASAAEIDATDALNRDRIPRAYRKGVKNYFDRLGDEFNPTEPAKAGPSEPKKDEASEKK